MTSRILLIVEGEVDEPRILGSETHGLLSLINSKYKIVPFRNNIYQLYKEYKEGKYDDIVAFLNIEKGLELPEGTTSYNAFSSVYLIFDFEPQDSKYSDDIIRDMVRTFDNETELGKLYVNYPMVESYYDLKCLPDPNYNKRTVNLESFKSKEYKKAVNISTCLKKNRITNKELCYIIMHNYNKSKILTNSNSDYIDYNALLEIQLQYKNRNNKLYVLSTFPLLAIDYNLNEIIKVLKLKLKNNYIEIITSEIKKI